MSARAKMEKMHFPEHARKGLVVQHRVHDVACVRVNARAQKIKANLLEHGPKVLVVVHLVVTNCFSHFLAL